jgi:hypothetical protein
LGRLTHGNHIPLSFLKNSRAPRAGEKVILKGVRLRRRHFLEQVRFGDFFRFGRASIQVSERHDDLSHERSSFSVQLTPDPRAGVPVPIRNIRQAANKNQPPITQMKPDGTFFFPSAFIRTYRRPVMLWIFRAA